jgi:hypothetical protein
MSAAKEIVETPFMNLGHGAWEASEHSNARSSLSMPKANQKAHYDGI